MKTKKTKSQSISIGDVRSELRANGELSLNHSRVRRLAGKTTGQIALSDLIGKLNKPKPPVISESGFGSVRLTSDSGTHIVFNGETKVSGSWWYYTGTTVLNSNAYAFWPAEPGFGASRNSDSLNVKILGRPPRVQSDGDEGLYAVNGNNINVNAYQRSTKVAIRSGWFKPGSDVHSEGNPVWVGANRNAKIFHSRSKDGFDDDENRAGRHLSYNTYTYLEASGHIRSAAVQYILEHRNYRLGQIIHTDPGFK
ncbi:MAG: hypothetical protein ACRCXX_13560 [Cetobacterium sp.]|uniref:hypothetical protein n=1 Tax=Cetobacterium sp. TaxID=2071632 RepID=UPI003F370632